MIAEQVLYTVSAPVVTLIVALLIPIVNGLITKYTLPGGIKGLITLALNTIMAFITTSMSATGAAVFSVQTLYTAALGFVVSVASYSGIYRGLGLTSSSVNGKLGPDTGIGPAPEKDQGYSTLLTVLIVVGIVLGIVLILANVDFNTK